jgi:hypothetical protein
MYFCDFRLNFFDTAQQLSIIFDNLLTRVLLPRMPTFTRCFNIETTNRTHKNHSNVSNESY